MRASPPRVVVALIVALWGWPLRGQSPPDSGTPRPDPPIGDADHLVPERGVRDLSDLLISRVPGLLVTPGSGLTDMGSRIRVRGVQTLDGDRAPVVLVDGVRVDQTEDD